MALKRLGWIGTAKKELLAFPAEVVRDVGYALYLAQKGEKAGNARPLKGFGGASVLEVIEDHEGDTYRAVYTVRFAEVVYVLHAFQKKSRKGIATPPQEIEKIRFRLKRAEEEHRTWQSRNR